jgi:hypothetical protein
LLQPLSELFGDGSRHLCGNAIDDFLVGPG